MSLLYPRLLQQVARSRYEQFLEQRIDTLTAESATHAESAVFIATGGGHVTPEKLSEIRSEVVARAAVCGFPDRQPNRAERAAFDVEVARYLHQHCGMTSAEASSADVWSFFALVLLPDVNAWRFPTRRRDRSLPGDMARQTFGRLWWRAHFVFDRSQPDPYAYLDRIGGEQFGQIYERRDALGANPRVIRSIIRVWDAPSRSANRDAFRDALKRLLRLSAFVQLDALPDAQLDALVADAVEQSLVAFPKK